MSVFQPDQDYRFRMGGVEDAFHNVDAMEVLPVYLEDRGHKRVFIISSKTLNTKTDVVRRLEACLGDKFVGITDEVGEHSPMNNVIKAAKAVRDSKADLILAVGGGSVMDLSKFVVLAVTEGVYEKEALLELQLELKPDLSDVLYPQTPPALRQIFIPTTMATAEWTPGGTPIIEETQLKARFIVNGGAPRAIVYDPEIAALTPEKLLLSTAVRGLDHAINTSNGLKPHPISSVLADQAIKLYIENLPLLKKDRNDRQAMSNCQLATAYSGLATMSVMHGFSHWMVHIVGPYASVGHSDAACVLMLAQAKWQEGYAVEQHARVKALLGRPDTPFHVILEELLNTLDMPTHFEDLGLDRARVMDMAPLALEHPFVTEFNLRPIKTVEDVRAVLSLACKEH